MSDESLFREVDEEVRQEAYQKLWDKYGTALIMVCAAVILFVAGYKAYQHYQAQQAEADSILYSDGLKLAAEGKPDQAKQLFSLVKQKGFVELSAFQVAGSMERAGQWKDAANAFKSIADDGTLSQDLRDVAAIRAGYLLVDIAPPAEVKALIGHLDAPDNALRFHAEEILGLAAYRAGDYVEAQRVLNAIFLDKNAPPEMKSRAQVMLQLITPHLPA